MCSHSIWDKIKQATFSPLALGSCDRASWAKCEEREKNQQDATIGCLLSTSVSTCFGHHYAHLQENKDRVLLIQCTALVLLDVVGSGCEALRCKMRASTMQRPTTAINHIQQNQRSTPYAVPHGLCSPEDGHNDARYMLR